MIVKLKRYIKLFITMKTLAIFNIIIGLMSIIMYFINNDINTLIIGGISAVIGLIILYGEIILQKLK